MSSFVYRKMSLPLLFITSCELPVAVEITFNSFNVYFIYMTTVCTTSVLVYRL